MEVTSYKPGTPCYVDIGVSNIDAAKKFYGGLFGWTFVNYGINAGGYVGAFLNDKSVAGLGPSQNPDVPPYWTTYISVEDVDISCKAADQAGGTLVAGPMEVPDTGRIAVLKDTVGAFISLFEPGKEFGAQIINEPGALTWNDLNTREPQKAIEFYESVFGWKASDANRTMPYTEWLLDGRQIGGLFTLGADMPADVPSHWATYFCVAELEAALEKVKQLGGDLLMGPMDIDPGRMAIVRDDQGASFDIVELREIPIKLP